MARARRIAAHVAGEEVRLALMEARPAGLTTAQLAAATGLSVNQVRVGIRWIRNTGAAQHQTPLTWTLATGFVFSQDVADWIAFEATAFTAVTNTITRVVNGTVTPHAALLPDDETVEQIMDALAGLRAHLRVLTALGKPRR